jgi:hypothetical protein
MEDLLHIYRKITQSGVEIKIKSRKYKIDYPYRIWGKFPKSLHKIFADSLTYIATWHLPLVEKKSLVYHFSHPFIEPTFFKILLYSIPMSIYEIENTLTSEVLKHFYNSQFKTQFKAIGDHFTGKKVKRRLKDKAIILFSFGKESLLTYGLLEELGVTPIPFFMKEPQSTYENTHKRKLANKFEKRVGTEVNFFPLSFGRLRQDEDMFWGWDIILSQYVFTLIPYYFYHHAKYLFLGGEQSCNFYSEDQEGYLVNPVFEQSIAVLQLLKNIPELFAIGTHIGSLVEPLHEIFITYLLHHRYSEIGRFQMSCFSEEPEAKKSRWCGHCEKCARMYIFFKALNISPERVGFYNDKMLSSEKRNLYPIFNHGETSSAYGGSGLGKDEQLLAFYLAYKNGVKGKLIDEFVRLYLPQVEKRREKLFKEYFGVHSSYSLPSSLRRKVLKICEKEKESVVNYLKRLLK